MATDPTITVLRPAGVLDVDAGEVLDGAEVWIDGDRIAAITSGGDATGEADRVIDLPGLTLVPGLMDMEVDLVLGGPGAGFSDPVRMDPAKMTLRAAANARRTLRAGLNLLQWADQVRGRPVIMPDKA